ncbi:hypothetical protein [Burkholderia contaminans]|uniref:LexA repressor DNA-binding domain-containing protein n=1 Tax=Burkholderia contaminans TaxID=488447 RepID=A0A3N8QQG8_9BURK|nr:hypothetical protein [Burkholderia contaminans]RQT26042.1 hypothetical protein DF037_20340 [Burkholderia contaminans]
MNLTTKQIEIMKVVVAGNTANAEWSPSDIDQILERLPYRTTKESLQFSLRALEKHGLIDRSSTEHRRGRVRRLVAPTPTGSAVIAGTPRPEPAVRPSAPVLSEVSSELSGPVIPELVAVEEFDVEPGFVEEVLVD